MLSSNLVHVIMTVTVIISLIIIKDYVLINIFFENLFVSFLVIFLIIIDPRALLILNSGIYHNNIYMTINNSLPNSLFLLIFF